MREFIKKRRWLVVLFLVIIIGAGAILFFRNSRSDTASLFQTEAVERGDLTATIGATGTVRAKQTATLIWQAAGTVDTVNVKVGDNIPAGFVMSFLGKTSLPQSIILAEADLASAQKQLDELVTSDTALAQATIAVRDAQKVYDRAANWRIELNGKIHIKKIIYKTFGNRRIPILKEYRGYADEKTITKAEEDLALAQAKLDDAHREFDRLAGGNLKDIAAAQARVDAAQATINLARIIAPFPGTVTESQPLSGDQVSAGATAFRLDNLTSLFVDVEVSEVDINSVSIGQPAILAFDAILNRNYQGEVVEVAKAGNNVGGVVNFTVTVELTNPDEFVKPGMTAAVNITVEERVNVLLVPNRSVRLVDGQRIIYLLVDGQPVKKEVSLGSSSDTMSVLSGGEVTEGDLIILNPPSEGGGPFGG